MKIKSHRLLLCFVWLFLCLLFSGCKSTTTNVTTHSTIEYFIKDTSDSGKKMIQLLYKEDMDGLKAWQKTYTIRKEASPSSLSTHAFSHSVRLIDYPVFMDDTGFITTFKKKPENVAVLFSSYAEVWQLAGGNVSITVAESVMRGIVKEEDVKLVGTGSGKEVNYELLLSYQPDLVILTADYESHQKLADRLRIFDIPVLVLRMDSFLDYLNMLSIFTTILDTKENYELYGTQVLDDVEAVIAHTNQIHTKPSVLFLRAYSYGAKVKTNNHFVGQMLEELGAINIAKRSDFPLDTLSQEFIAASDVDSIFISMMGEEETAVRHYIENDLLVMPAFSNLTAVTEKSYYILTKELFSYKPNHRWAQAYEYLARLLYPNDYIN